MSVSDYNKGRSVTDLEVKDWTHGKPDNLRSDGTWVDDRYDPLKYSHPHRNDNVNFPNMEYTNVFGGTLGDAEREEYAKHTIGLMNGFSTAMMDYQT
jgi:hypothetical protein